MIHHFGAQAKIPLQADNQLSQANASEQYTCKILAIDGGGIRGVIPAYILQTLKAQLGKGDAGGGGVRNGNCWAIAQAFPQSRELRLILLEKLMHLKQPTNSTPTAKIDSQPLSPVSNSMVKQA